MVGLALVSAGAGNTALNEEGMRGGEVPRGSVELSFKTIFCSTGANNTRELRPEGGAVGGAILGNECVLVVMVLEAAIAWQVRLCADQSLRWHSLQKKHFKSVSKLIMT